MRNPGDIHVWAPAFDTFGGGIGAFSRAAVEAFRSTDVGLDLFGRFDPASATFSGLPVKGGSLSKGVHAKANFFMVAGSAALLRRPKTLLTTHVNFAPVSRVACQLSGARHYIAAHGVEIAPSLSDSRIAALKSARAVLAVSQWTRSRLIDLGVEPAHIAVVGNTVDECRFNVISDRERAREAWGIQHNHFVLTTVARHDASEAYKGCDTVLHALAKLTPEDRRDLRYLVGGTGSDIPRLRQLTHDLDLNDHVRWLGFVPELQLPSLYGMSDAFVMASRGEGFGIAFLESMACGTPVIGGDADGSVDALQAGWLGRLIDPDEPESLTSAIVELHSGQGHAHWFDRSALRREMLMQHGREVFADRILQAINMGAG